MELEQQLASVPLLAGLEPRARHRLAEVGKRRTYAPGEEIVREGTTGTALYILLTGAARVEQDGQELGQLSAGDFFGELDSVDGALEMTLGPAEIRTVQLRRRERTFARPRFADAAGPRLNR